ncbi:hypothetical protein [Paraburkholderia terrae]
MKDRDLKTSAGGRAYIAEFFATQLRRHDFQRYIEERLAADFACALAQYLSERDTSPSAPAVDAGAFEWPLLPEFPNAMWTCNGACLFTEHQMHGYANAYGEIVRAALSARSDAAAGEPFAYYRDCVYGSGTTMREYNRINEFADGGEGSPLYSGPQAASGQKLKDRHEEIMALAIDRLNRSEHYNIATALRGVMSELAASGQNLTD